MIEYENLTKTNKAFVKEYKQAFSSVLNKGWFILGDSVRAFEDSFARYCGVNHCIGVASGFDALLLSLKVFHFKHDAEILVPANTCIASILPILQSGLKPVLVEPNIRTYNMDPSKIEEKITSKTVAIMVVHLYGKSCNMKEIMSLVKKYNLKLIEDCAQSHGARFQEKIVGTFGHCNAFSFYPTKNLGALGDGGAVVTNDDNLAKKIRMLRNYGSEIKYRHEIIGYNSRLDEVQAAFLSVKLKHLDSINAHKRKLADIYHSQLKGDFIKPALDSSCFDVYHIFNIRHPERDRIKAYLLKKNIKTEIHYPVPPHRQNALKHLFRGQSYPITDEIHRTTLSLPISYGHSRKEIERVIDIINNYY